MSHAVVDFLKHLSVSLEGKQFEITKITNSTRWVESDKRHTNSDVNMSLG